MEVKIGKNKKERPRQTWDITVIGILGIKGITESEGKTRNE